MSIGRVMRHPRFKPTEELAEEFGTQVDFPCCAPPPPTPVFKWMATLPWMATHTTKQNENRRPTSQETQDKVGNRNRYSPVRRAKRPRSFVVRALGHDGDEVLSRREKMPLPLKATTSGRQDLLLQTFEMDVNMAYADIRVISFVAQSSSSLGSSADPTPLPRPCFAR